MWCLLEVLLFYRWTKTVHPWVQFRISISSNVCVFWGGENGTTQIKAAQTQGEHEKKVSGQLSLVTDFLVQMYM